MKAIFTREYYEKNWDRFIQKVPGDSYINMEAELDREMKVYRETDLDEQALSVIEKMLARKIYDKAMHLVRAMMRTIEDVEAGRSSFGYTTQLQEIQARADYRKRFEFNCVQLAHFRERYSFS